MRQGGIGMGDLIQESGARDAQAVARPRGVISITKRTWHELSREEILSLLRQSVCLYGKKETGVNN